MKRQCGITHGLFHFDMGAARRLAMGQVFHQLQAQGQVADRFRAQHQHGVAGADFLRQLWAAGDDDLKLAAWIKEQRD